MPSGPQKTQTKTASTDDSGADGGEFSFDCAPQAGEAEGPAKKIFATLGWRMG